MLPNNDIISWLDNTLGYEKVLPRLLKYIEEQTRFEFILTSDSAPSALSSSISIGCGTGVAPSSS